MGNDGRKKKMQQSSSRRETTPGNSSGQTSKAIGCMSSLLQLFSRQHSRRRIPSGNSESQARMPAARKESIDSTETAPTPALPQPEFTEAVKTKRTMTNGDARIDGGLARRSPTLPLEIRRSGCCFDHGDSPRRSSALLARLMGLEEPTPTQPTTAVGSGLSVDSAEEKRRTLLGALERCDEDLRALKLIIDAIRTAEMRRSKFAGEQSGHQLKFPDGNGEQPSPVSVLDVSWSPKSRSSENATAVLVPRALAPVFSEVAQKKDWRSVAVGCSPKRRMTAEGIPRPPAVPAAAKESCGSRVEEMGEEAMFAERKEGATVIAELADDVAVDLVNSLVMEQWVNSLCIIGSKSSGAAGESSCRRAQPSEQQAAISLPLLPDPVSIELGRRVSGPTGEVPWKMFEISSSAEALLNLLRSTPLSSTIRRSIEEALPTQEAVPRDGRLPHPPHTSDMDDGKKRSAQTEKPAAAVDWSSGALIRR